MKRSFRKRIINDFINEKISHEELISAGIRESDFDFVYYTSRNSGLSFVESFYNAIYIHSLERFDKSEKTVSSELVNTFSHPRGWYKNSFRTWKDNFWSRFFSVLQKVPKSSEIVANRIKEMPSNAKKQFDNSAARMDNSVRVFRGIRYLFLKLVHFLSPIVLAIVLFSYAIGNLDKNIALEIYVNGEKIGAVESSDQLVASKRLLEKNLSDSIGDNFRFTDEITYAFTSARDVVYLSESEMYSALYSVAKKKIRSGYGLYVDGALVAASENKAALDRAVEELRERYLESIDFYSREENISLSYFNNVSVIAKDFPVEYLSDENRVREILGLSIEEKDHFDYKLSYRDVLYNSVTRHVKKDSQTQKNTNITAITTETGLSAEPGVLTSTHLNNSVEVDITFEYVVTKIENVKESYPYEVEYVETDSFLLGSKKIETFGKNGFRNAVYAVSYKEDKEISRELVSEEIITPAQNRIIFIGTRIPTEEELKTTATGNFILPYDGYVSSAYGMRKVKKFGTREFHNALDIPGPYGSDIKASDGGVVTTVGYSSGYGRYVLIDHENGYETVYAHLSKATVKSGDRVGQGDIIGKMGATGRVTGVHVHFEVRKDGVAINPEDVVGSVPRK